MENISSILVVSSMTPYSSEVFNYGLSLARQNDAKLQVLHLVSTPDSSLSLMEVSAPGLFPKEANKDFKEIQLEAKEALDKIIKLEKKNGFPIKELIRISDRDAIKTIMKVVQEEKIDLIIMHAHAEGHLEHLFGGVKDAIIRRLPCSVLLVKKESMPMN